jgi:DNA-binding beta-propeller fold protein YncE
MTFSLRAAMTAALLASVAVPASAEQVFNRIASFPVASNLPADKDKKATTSAEIITASEDGNTLVYSDSPLGAIGFIDITDPKAPKALGALTFKGEPTSVAAAGKKVLAAVNTGESKAKPTGILAVVDIASKKVDLTCDLGGQPDSIAISKDKSFAAIAIENERDEEVNGGALPQMPAGDLVIVSLKDGTADCASIKHVDLKGIAEVAPEDPEPEFVAINDAGEIAVTLQENNHIAIIDGKTAKIVGHFSAGKADLDGIDNRPTVSLPLRARPKV